MRRSHVAKDILDALYLCMSGVIGDRCREYVWARTRGVPPADCNSITASWMDREQHNFGDCENVGECREWDALLGLRIVLTRVCMGPDQQPSFAWELEDAAAACFDDDLDLIEECLNCMDWTTIMQSHGIDVIYAGTTNDIEAEGGGYSAYIELTIRARECCTIGP